MEELPVPVGMGQLHDAPTAYRYGDSLLATNAVYNLRCHCFGSVEPLLVHTLDWLSAWEPATGTSHNKYDALPWVCAEAPAAGVNGGQLGSGSRHRVIKHIFIHY